MTGLRKRIEETLDHYGQGRDADDPEAIEFIEPEDGWRLIRDLRQILREHTATDLHQAWDEGLEAGRDRWMDSREFGDPPRNPYPQSTD